MMSFYNRYFKEKLELNFCVTIVFGDRLIWRPFVTEKKLNFSLILNSYIELMKATFPNFPEILLLPHYFRDVCCFSINFAILISPEAYFGPCE